MIKYLVKTVSVATPENVNFAGKSTISLYGKDQKMLYHETVGGELWGDFSLLTRWWIGEYGYGRICDAKRSWCYKNPENTKWWKTTVEIVPFEVKERGEE